MMNLFFDLPVIWMSVVVFAGLAVVNVLIYRAVLGLATDKRMPAFKAMSPVMLTPLAVVFGLIVAFLSAQVWSDAERANAAVTREASALGTMVLLGTPFPSETQAQMRALVRRHIQDAIGEEWPAMARQQTTLAMITAADTSALEFVLALRPQTEAQTAAQREMISALRNAVDARRDRIIVSRSKINWVKWAVVFLLAFLILVTIAIVHSDNRATAVLAMGLFSVATGACILLIASHNRPFTGEISVGTELLVQAMPKE
jgi:uncharacterized integral membrane protein